MRRARPQKEFYDGCRSQCFARSCCHFKQKPIGILFFDGILNSCDGFHLKRAQKFEFVVFNKSGTFVGIQIVGVAVIIGHLRPCDVIFGNVFVKKIIGIGLVFVIIF